MARAKSKAPPSIKLEHKEGTWGHVDGSLIREEWQILQGRTVHVFYSEAEAKAFVLLTETVWSGPGRYGFDVQHVVRHLHKSEKA